MTRTCQQLGAEERGVVMGMGMKTQHCSMRGIAKVTGKLPSTISRELRRKSWQGQAGQCVIGRTRVRALAVAMDKRHPVMPDAPTSKELGVDWVDGAYRGIGVSKSTPPKTVKRLSDLWATLNIDSEMKELAAKNGFELVNVGAEQMAPFMKERTRLYTEGAQRLGLGQGKK